MALTREQMIALKKKQAQKPFAEQDTLAPIKPYMQEGGRLLPIIGNSIIETVVFPFPSDDGQTPRIEETLADAWAEKVGYPYAERTRLARIAQFVLMRSSAPSVAKKSYVDFLKEFLLDAGEMLGIDVATVTSLRQRTGLTLAEISMELELTSSDEKSPLDFLAQMNLPLYITTSYYDFLELALKKAGKDPITHVCFWDGSPPPDAKSYTAASGFKPGDPRQQGFRPIVYHLLGHERFPSTMVLAEDDFLDYLKKIALDSTNSQRPIIPTYLRDQLANSALVMMGLNISDWDFRMLFHGVLPLALDSPHHPCIALQIDPIKHKELINDENKDQNALAKEARDYLENYFKRGNFRVILQDAGAFVRQLWQLWQQVQLEGV